MVKIEYILNKLRTKETVYLHYDLENVVVKYVPDGKGYKCFAKFKGDGVEREHEKDSDLIFEAEMRGEIISKKEYDKY